MYNNLKELRNSKNLSQAKIAKEVGISQKTYSNYENGKAVPTINNLTKIADFFHISLDSLVNRTTEDKYSSEIIELIDLVEQLPEKERNKVVGYAKFILEEYKQNKSADLKNKLK